MDKSRVNCFRIDYQKLEELEKEEELREAAGEYESDMVSARLLSQKFQNNFKLAAVTKPEPKDRRRSGGICAGDCPSLPGLKIDRYQAESFAFYSLHSFFCQTLQAG